MEQERDTMYDRWVKRKEREEIESAYKVIIGTIIFLIIVAIFTN